METAWVMTWRYSDGSKSGIVCVYTDKGIAERDFKLMQDHGDTLKQFSLEPVPIVR